MVCWNMKEMGLLWTILILPLDGSALEALIIGMAVAEYQCFKGATVERQNQNGPE